MTRFAEHDLDQWFKNKRRKVLVIRGARQVGKSTLVRNFAAGQNLELLEINLEQFPSPDIWKSMASETILREIQLAKQQKITGNTLLFIDEIQHCPVALSALRYLQEEKPELPVIAAGSLLEFVMDDQSYPMPVGRIQYYYLGPMTFREVLLARKKEMLEETLHNMDFDSPSMEAHRHLSDCYREYLYTGGMPEAVLASIEDSNILSSREIHRSIISTCQDDFSKYKKRLDPDIIRQVFHYVPLNSGNKIKYANINRDLPARKLKEAIDALIKAGVIIPAYHSSCSGIPLKVQADYSIYKLFFLDVGLSLYLNGLDWEDLRKPENLLINKGNISEQFIAQHLVYRSGGYEPPELFYWLREGKSTNAEVDFVLVHKGKLRCIEVKGGKSGSLRSLHQLVAKTGVDQAYRFNLNPQTRQPVETVIRTKDGPQSISFEILSFPAYSVETFLEH